VRKALFDPHYCHCRACQKASGAPAIAGAFLSKEALRFTRGEPKLYRSSPIVERGFCADCGTYLLYRPLIAEWSDWLIITIASLDRPNSVVPERHYGCESQLAWFDPQNDLPRERYEDDFIEIPKSSRVRTEKNGRQSWRASALPRCAVGKIKRLKLLSNVKAKGLEGDARKPSAPGFPGSKGHCLGQGPRPDEFSGMQRLAYVQHWLSSEVGAR
jgi:hypothetical protein